MSQGSVNDKWQPHHRLTEEGIGWHGKACRQPVFNNREAIVWIRANHFLISSKVLPGLFQVFSCQLLVLWKKIGKQLFIFTKSFPGYTIRTCGKINTKQGIWKTKGYLFLIVY